MTPTVTRSPLPKPRYQPRLASATSVAVGLILLFAAAAKGYGWYYAPPSEKDVATVVIVAAEWLLASWLLSGLAPRPGRLVALLLFTVFAGVTLLQALRGAESCGCFGPLAVNPWVTFAIDLGVTTALAVSLRLPSGSPDFTPTRVAMAGLVALLLPLSVLLAAPAATPAAEELADREADVVVLKPERWLGSRLPILDLIASQIDLAQGNWIVVLHRDGCDACESRIGDLVEATSSEGLLLVELPPFADPPTHEWGLPIGRLQPRRAEQLLFVETPIVLTLSDGVVRSVEVPQGEAAATAAPPTTAIHDAVPKNITRLTLDRFELDLGYVPTGGHSRGVLTLYNPTNRSVRVTDAEAECVCTTVEGLPMEVPPGEAAAVVVSFAAPSVTGPYKKGLRLTTDDLEVPVLSLQVTARIRTPLIAVPQRLELAAGQDSTLHVHNDGDQPVRLLYATSDNSEVSIAVPRDAIAPKGRVALAARTSSKAAGRASVSIVTDSKEQPAITVSLVVR